MKKNVLIPVVVILVIAVGVVSYLMASGNLFQGRLSLKARNNFIVSQGLCLDPEAYQEKYWPDEDKGGDSPPEGVEVSIDGGNTEGSNGQSRDGGNTERSDGGENSKTEDPKVVIIPPVIDGNAGSRGYNPLTGETTSSSGGSSDENYSDQPGNNQEKVVMEECSCARDGYTWVESKADGTNVKYICYVPDYFETCVDPDFKCPEGKQLDWPAVSDLCNNVKKKACFGAAKPDKSSKTSKMCAALRKYTMEGPCVNSEQCKEIGSWYQAGTLTENINKGKATFEEASACANEYSKEYYGK